MPRLLQRFSTQSPAAGAAPATEAARARSTSRRRLSRHQREQRQKRLILIGGSALLAFVALILGFGFWRENYGRAGESAAVILGERLTAGDLVEEIRPRLQNLNRQIALFQSAGLAREATRLEARKSELVDTTLREIVEDRLVRREAASRGIVVTPDEVEARLRKTISEVDAANQPRPTPAAAPAASTSPADTPTPVPTPTAVPTLTDDRFGPALQEYLNVTGETREHLRRSLEAQVYEEKLRAVIGAEIPPVQEQVHARHIVLRTEAEARESLQQLDEGADFAEVAAARSIDRATKDKGGDLGWRPRQGYDETFDSTVFALQPGQRSDVLRTSSGWEIVEAIERDPARPIDNSLLDQMQRQRYGDWLALAEGSPEVQRTVSTEMRDWIMGRASARRG